MKKLLMIPLLLIATIAFAGCSNNCPEQTVQYKGMPAIGSQVYVPLSYINEIYETQIFKIVQGKITSVYIDEDNTTNVAVTILNPQYNKEMERDYGCLSYDYEKFCQEYLYKNYPMDMISESKEELAEYIHQQLLK